MTGLMSHERRTDARAIIAGALEKADSLEAAMILRDLTAHHECVVRALDLACSYLYDGMVDGEGNSPPFASAWWHDRLIMSAWWHDRLIMEAAK